MPCEGLLLHTMFQFLKRFSLHLTSFMIFFSEPSYKNCAPTGEQLSEKDLQFLVKKTRFNKKIILSWFKNFRSECPNGKLSRSHLYGEKKRRRIF